MRPFNRAADAAGIACKFYKRNGVGYKLFHTKRECKYARDTQEEAAEHGLGPRVFGTIFEVQSLACHHKKGGSGQWGTHAPKEKAACRERANWWAYATELVTVVSHQTTLAESPWRPTQEAIERLGEALIEADMSDADLHEWNVGQTEDGRLVKIDFGIESTE